MFHIFCDFDGTITTRDATDFILERLAPPEWLELEAQWQKGLIGSGACMRAQVELITAPREELNQTLDEVQIDEGFAAFVTLCRSMNVPISIISDGVDHFIRYILVREGLDDIPVIANSLAITAENGYQLTSPYSDRACHAAAGVCKCKIVEEKKAQRIYVGDGRSDFCVSRKPEFVFAKGALAAHCKKHETPYIPYHNFFDVADGLRDLLHHSTLIKERK